MLGALCSRSAHARGAASGGVLSAARRQPWEFTLGYRFQPSSRHFVGSEEQRQRELLRNQLYAPRGEFRGASIGDVTIGPRVWLFRPPTESGGNIGVGVSLKLPAGEYNATSEATDAAGNRIVSTPASPSRPGMAARASR